MLLFIIRGYLDMALSPQKFREIVFQLLYSHDFFPETEDAVVDFMMEQLSVTKKNMKEALERQQKISSKTADIDEYIGRYSVAYDPSRIGKAEKNILRLGIYEICYDESVPDKVAIAEAIRLTRKFSTPESGSFVNAVLDALLKDRLISSVQDHAQSPAVSVL